MLALFKCLSRDRTRTRRYLRSQTFQVLTGVKSPESALDLRECGDFCGDAVSQWRATHAFREAQSDRLPAHEVAL
jgi:hypothetical protein